MEFWIYQNHLHGYVKVHRADCGHCRNGRGSHGTHSKRYGEWVGAFGSQKEACAAAARTGKELRPSRCCDLDCGSAAEPARASNRRSRVRPGQEASLPQPIPDAVARFARELATPYHRYKSWDHCYLYFRAYHCEPQAPEVLDTLALHLAMFLASWGMYRGSGDLLQLDYRAFEPAVKVILRPEYESLWGLDPSGLQSDRPMQHTRGLIHGAGGLAARLRAAIPRGDEPLQASDILVSKIMLGTLGCSVAHDTYVKRGLRECGLTQKLGPRAFGEILEFYYDHRAEFEAARTPPVPAYYPPMKMLDMYFWILGGGGRQSK